MTLQRGQRRPKERDFVRTREGMFFCVTGYLHPPDRYTAYLKYSPSPLGLGKWRDRETTYRRELPYYHVRNVAETIRYLEQRYPWHVHYCPVRDIRFSMVPQEYVARYYEPQERLAEILAGPRDSLEEEARGLAMEIAARAGIRPDDLGVTGSILISLHNPSFSDLDLLVYGLENARKVQEALREGKSVRIRGLNEGQVARWSQRIAERFSLTLDEARYLADRRWNYGFYGERYFSIHPTRTDAEIIEQYGDRIYRSLGSARIRAVVVEAGEAIFQPSVYRVGGVVVLDGDPEAAGVHEIISYEGLYRDVVGDGDEIEARGKLESVNERDYRLVIGTTMLGGEEYVKPAIGERMG